MLGGEAEASQLGLSPSFQAKMILPSFLFIGDKNLLNLSKLADVCEST